MGYKITDKCVGCGSCAAQCPMGAITEGTPYVIDHEKCIGCGACASQCPMQAIVNEE